MPAITLSAPDFSKIISVASTTGFFGYGYGTAKGQIGIAFAGMAAQTATFSYGQAVTMALGTVTQNETTTGTRTYQKGATDENGYQSYTFASNQAVYTSEPNPGTTILGGFYSPLEGTGGTGVTQTDNTISSSNADLDVPLSIAIAEGTSAATLSFLAALPRLSGPAPAGTTGKVTLVHGYVADPEVDYTLDLGTQTATFANGDKLTVAFAPLSLSDNPQSAALNATLTLLQGATYALTATDATKLEGNAGSTPFTFAVTRTGDSTAAATLSYAVTGTGTNPATAASFTGGVLPTGTVSFAAGDKARTITVNVAGNTIYEPDKTFAVTLTGPAGATVATSSAAGTILNDDPGAQLAYQNATTNQSGVLAMDPASAGGPGYLQWQYIYSGSDNLALATQTPNVFIHSGSGFDAIQVTSGNNVLDGGLGSNFLTGGTGTDTFFTDARNPGVVWNTLRNFHAADAATLWGFTAGVSSYRWEPTVAGAPGSEGATLRANIVGGNGRTGDGIDASITFTGISVERAKGLQLVTGTQPAGNYLYIYNPGV